MGSCAGSKTEKTDKKEDVKAGAAPSNAKGVPGKTSPDAAAAQAQVNAVKKLTAEQVEQRRKKMRQNLQEGHPKPPVVNFPHIGIAITSE